MKWSTLFLPVLLLLAGCAVSPPGGGGPEALGGSDDNPAARLHTELGARYFERGQYAIALQELRIALSADSAYAPAYNILGLVHGELREDTVAEGHFKRSLELSPNYSEAHNNYGLFLCQRARKSDALRHFDSALSNPLYSTPDKALANAGNCELASQGDPARAENYFVRALKRAPNQATALLGMAEVHYRLGRWLAARSVLRQYGAQVGDAAMTPQALWLGVRVERKLGEREAEANYGAQLRRNHPESMQAQWLISGDYGQAGSPL
jgi:type IV pilus assembly protein PilF